MPSQTRSCGTEDEIVRDGMIASWSFASGELAASDNVTVTGLAMTTSGEFTQYLYAKNFGFTVPTTATIQGIVVLYERKHSGGTAQLQDDTVRLVNGSAAMFGNNLNPADVYDATDDIISCGDTTEMWGLAGTLTPAVVNDADFGVAIGPTCTANGTSNSPVFDHVQITVYYSEGGGGGGGAEDFTGALAQTEVELMEKYIGDNLTFYAQFVDATLLATDATGTPAYKVYEEETGTAILSGSLALLDDAGTTGFYSEQIAISAANGFEVGKDYVVRVTATVTSVAQAGIVAKFTVRRNYWEEVPTEVTGRATTPWVMLHQVWKRFFNKMTMNRDTGAVILYNNDGTTSEVEGTNSTSGATETRGGMS